MVEIKMKYVGDLACEVEHGPSGTRMTTDAPLGNQGQARSFSPTDLLGVSLSTCVMTIMGIASKQRGWDLGHPTAKVEKSMIADPHRRIAKLEIAISGLPASFDERQRETLEQAGSGCPVEHSLHPDTEVVLDFHWDG
jgi:putative redox protein